MGEQQGGCRCQVLMLLTSHREQEEKGDGEKMRGSVGVQQGGCRCQLLMLLTSHREQVQNCRQRIATQQAHTGL